MSRFFSARFAQLEPYVPGEQPRDQQYVKLNTNENPYPPLPEVVAAATAETGRSQLYSDPECTELRAALAAAVGVSPDQITVSNGSDEVLYFAFMAFCDADHPAVFPDITYGFYPVFAQVTGAPFRIIPLLEDWTMDLEAMAAEPGPLILANPNAPTGLAIPRKRIEEMLRARPDRLVVVDEAYVDFGAESCVPLIREYDNLLVVQTFSKSRSMAGARLGYGIACPDLIRDLNTIRYSINPYNVNRITQGAGVACLRQDAYNKDNCRRIMETREESARCLRELGFVLNDSSANFFFARHPGIGGEELYRLLKARGILIRHFNIPRIQDYNRITVGTPEQMDKLLEAVQEILDEKRAAGPAREEQQ